MMIPRRFGASTHVTVACAFWFFHARMSIRDEVNLYIKTKSLDLILRIWQCANACHPKPINMNWHVHRYAASRGNASTSLDVFSWSRVWIFRYKEKHDSRDARVRQTTTPLKVGPASSQPLHFPMPACPSKSSLALNRFRPSPTCLGLRLVPGASY
jgi:hypothetical protein